MKRLVKKIIKESADELEAIKELVGPDTDKVVNKPKKTLKKANKSKK